MYCNISRDVVSAWINLCPICNLAAVQFNKAPLLPMIPKGFLERLQIDLIDMQTKPSGSFKYIGHVADHFSKFRVAFALPTKHAIQVVEQLNNRVFCYFGLPSIFHSDNGREFVNDIITATILIWPGICSIVNGGVRHSQSQGNVEQGNATIERMISKKIHETGQKNWHDWLPQIQFALNTTVVRSTKKTPYEIVFGQIPNCHLSSLTTQSGPIDIDEVQDIIQDDDGPEDDIDFEVAESKFLKMQQHAPTSSTINQSPTSKTQMTPSKIQVNTTANSRTLKTKTTSTMPVKTNTKLKSPLKDLDLPTWGCKANHNGKVVKLIVQLIVGSA
ncbi:KRAB-A domain-containing protein 2-like [Clytia hemisphaerica]|uniref:KRAB-A domain-containing protein 2-like n=1 Tax=Clytia hemisphaerica TaxID=252671 RepID=UPI0034D5089F